MEPIDLNADLGEGYGPWSMTDDAGLIDVVTSANIACGFHAGDPMIMREVCQRAADHDVSIGAHVGFRDLLGFGRRELPTPPEELHAEALYQIGALDAFARRAGTKVRYVKPHGALYHAASRRPEVAAALVEAIQVFDPDLVLLGAAGSQAEAAANTAGVRFAAEGFADRAYTEAGTLVPRGTAGAVHHDVDQMVQQVRSMVVDHSVTTTTGTTVPLNVASICVHGDTPGAVSAAQAIRASLAESVDLRPFA